MKRSINEMEKRRGEIVQSVDMDRFVDEKDEVPEDVFSDVMGGMLCLELSMHRIPKGFDVQILTRLRAGGRRGDFEDVFRF